MIRDLSFWVAVSQLVLVLMGVWVALHEDWAKRHRFLVLAGFVIAGFAGLYMTRQQSRQSGEEVAEAQRLAAEANTKLSNTLEKINNQSVQIGNQTGEISRVQGLNTELQNKLLNQSGQLIDSGKRISELSKQGINTSTGGDSFPSMDLVGPPIVPNGSAPIFNVHGQYPLYGVHARIIDVPKLDALSKTRKLQLFEGEINLDLGDLTTSVALIPPNPPVFQFGQAETYQIVVYFNARNGTWREDYQLRRVGDHYSRAIRVFLQQRNGKDRLVYYWTDKEYPK